MTVPEISTLDESISPTLLSRPLASKWRDMLTSGDHPLKSRSEAVAAVVLAMVNAGWSWPEYHAAMTNPGEHKLAEWFYYRGARYRHRSRSPQDVQRRLESTWDRAVTKAKTSPAIISPAEARQEIGLIRERFRSCPITSRTRVTDSLVLEWLHVEATQRARIVLFASRRDVAQALGIGGETASRALERLVKAGWLRREDRDRAAHASTFRLTMPRTESADDTQTQSANEPQSRRDSPGRENCGSFADSAVDSAGQDVFLHLGRYALMVYVALEEHEGRCAQEVGSRAGVGRTACFKHLKTLKELGMAESTEGLWRRTEKPAEAAAAELGVTGLGEQRKALLDAERGLWGDVVARVQFAQDKERWGMRVAVENALKAQGEQVPEGVDVLTGEIVGS